VSNTETTGAKGKVRISRSRGKRIVRRITVMNATVIIMGIIVLWIALSLILASVRFIKMIWARFKYKKIPDRPFRASNLKALAKGR
jgi:hypothetical protein